VSYNLAYGLQRLYFKITHLIKMYSSQTTVIEGRTVNQRDTYCIRGYLTRKKLYRLFIEDIMFGII
jgi:hypothetical protein